jgi:hypothetical protein
MEQFPVESNYGRMLVEAKQFSKEVQAKLAASIAIQEIGGIVKGGTRFTGWRKFTKQFKSDLLAQYDVYLALPTISEEQYEELGIISKNVDKAEEVIERLNRDLSLTDVALTPIDASEEGPLLRCITSGEIDQLWSVIDDNGTVEHIFSGQQREFSSSTVVKNPTLITGTPFDLQVPLRSGGLETLHLVTGVTIVNTEVLLEISPHLFESKRGRTLYDPRMGSIVDRQQVRFGKRVLEGASVPRYEDSIENRKLFAREYSRWAFDQLTKQHRELERFHKRVPMVTIERVQQELRSKAPDVVTLEQLSGTDKQKVIALSKLETYFGADFIYNLGKPRRQPRPEDKRRKGWAPKHKRKTKRDSKW